MRSPMSRVLVGVLAVFLATSACVAPNAGKGTRKDKGSTSITLAASPTASPIPGRAEGRAGAVAAEHQRAADIGLAMLERGGNAVDAAIATAYAVCILNASSCGIGGGGFMLVHQTDGSVERARLSRDGAGARPSRHVSARRRGPGRALPPRRAGHRGPGRVAGLEEARERFARLPRDVLMAPAIALARDGFPLGPHLAKEINQNLTALRATPALAALFLDPAGNPRPEGDVIRMPALATTLERIAPRRCEPVLPRDHRRRDRRRDPGRRWHPLEQRPRELPFPLAPCAARHVPRLRGVHDAAAELRRRDRGDPEHPRG